MNLKIHLIRLTILMALCLALPGRAATLVTEPPAGAMATALHAWFQSVNRQIPEDAASRRHISARQISRVYAQHRFQPLWTHHHGFTHQGAAVITFLRNTMAGDQTGLSDQMEYIDQTIADTDILVRTGLAFPMDTLVQLEVRLTRLVLHQFEAGQAGPCVRSRNKSVDGAEGHVPMAQAAAARQLSQWIDSAVIESFHQALGPQIKQYRALEKNLVRYETIQQLGGWPQIPDGARLRTAKRDGRMPLLRWRLVMTGDMPLAQLSADTQLNPPLDRAIRRFQRRHGLETDGIVGPATLAALNAPVERRISQIRLNMERWRRMPNDLGDRYLMVNIPRFQLDVVEKDRVVHSMRVIVGKKQRRTPVMKGRMTYLELNPYWNIPRKIARQDLLPRIKQDPSFLVRQKIEVFDSWDPTAERIDPLNIDWQRYSESYLPLRLRQAPAAMNALGKIKFMFPNGYSVYIHDTPGKSLFKRNQRSFSSGCVRVEDPVKLASYLLKDQDRDRKRLFEKLETLERQVIVLKRPVPVYLVYLTAWADEDGTPYFVDDLYSRDPALSAQLSSRGCPPPQES